MSDSFGKNFQVGKFDGNDFPVWKAQIESLLRAKDMAHVLTAKRPIEEKLAKEFDPKDSVAKSLLLLSLDNKHARLVLSCSTAREIWSKLIQIHEKKSVASKLIMQREFFELRMRPDEKVEDYVSRAEYLHGQLQNIGVNSIDEITLVGKIVNGLPRRYMNFISNWSIVENSKQNLDELLPRLMAEEALIDNFKTRESAAMSAEGKKWSPRKKDNRQSNKSESSKKKTPIRACWLCKGNDHLKKDCPERKSKKDSQEVNACIAESNITVSMDVWVLDSGATEHMTYDNSSFYTYKALDRKKPIRFGNGEFLHCVGVGDIKVRSETGRIIELRNVSYVPDIRRKLISLSSITEHGNYGNIVKDKIIIRSHNGNVLFTAEKCGMLYRATLEELDAEANVTQSLDDLDLLHRRFGHINKSTLSKMIKKHSVIGLENAIVRKSPRSLTSRIDCEACQEGKQSKKSYPSSTRTRSKEVGERVHVDLCGPIGTPTCSGKNYFVLFKDEYSNYRHIFFIKTKDEVYDSVRSCIAMIKVDTGEPVKRLFSDHGSELISNRTQEFLLSQNIIHEMSAPFTPQQNGFIERDNRTVVEAARTMLMGKKLPEMLWGEAANTAVYLLNRSCNSNTGVKTPYELYFGSKPKVGHVRVFGSLAYMKLQHKKRSGYQKKLEPRAKKVVLVGYEKDQTYRVYDPETGKVLVTREINIDEEKSFDFNNAKKDNDDLYISLDELIGFWEANDYLDEQHDPEDDIPGPSDVHEETDEVSDYSTPDDQTVTIRPPASNPKAKEVSKENLQLAETSKESTGGSAIPKPKGTTHSYGLRSRNTQSEAHISEALVSYGDEPANYKDAMNGPDSKSWKLAMDEEYNSLIKQGTWILRELPPGRKAIKCKWVYKVKYNTSGNIERYKARLVAKGYSQKYGIDYNETFSPVVRLDSIRLMLALVAKMDMDMIHFDVKTAFLHGKLEEDIYMQQPEGYEKGSGVCWLKKSIYGLKQASRAWNKCFTDFLKRFSLNPLVKDSCILIRDLDKQNSALMIAIYVDDGLACSNNRLLLHEVTEHLKTKFEITIMDPKCFVGLEIQRDRSNRLLLVDQKYYVRKIIERFEMSNSKQVSTPCDPNQKLTKMGVDDGQDGKIVDVRYREAIGSLMYVMTGSRPDIAYSVNLLARYCESPRLSHWKAVKRVFQYLNSTPTYGIMYGKGRDQVGDLECYVDSDYASDIDTRKSVTGYVLKYFGGPIVWKSTKQATVATSTTEAEFVAASQACKETMWARQLLHELNAPPKQPTNIYVDNQGAIKLIVNNQIHSKSKHIDIKYMFVREVVQLGKVEIKYVRSEDNQADILTKALPRDRFEKLRSHLAIVSNNQCISK